MLRLFHGLLFFGCCEILLITRNMGTALFLWGGLLFVLKLHLFLLLPAYQNYVMFLQACTWAWFFLFVFRLRGLSHMRGMGIDHWYRGEPVFGFLGKRSSFKVELLEPALGALMLYLVFAQPNQPLYAYAYPASLYIILTILVSPFAYILSQAAQAQTLDDFYRDQGLEPPSPLWDYQLPPPDALQPATPEFVHGLFVTWTGETAIAIATAVPIVTLAALILHNFIEYKMYDHVPKPQAAPTFTFPEAQAPGGKAPRSLSVKKLAKRLQ